MSILVTELFDPAGARRAERARGQRGGGRAGRHRRRHRGAAARAPLLTPTLYRVIMYHTSCPVECNT